VKAAPNLAEFVDGKKAGGATCTCGACASTGIFPFSNSTPRKSRLDLFFTAISRRNSLETPWSAIRRKIFHEEARSSRTLVPGQCPAVMVKRAPPHRDQRIEPLAGIWDTAIRSDALESV